VAAVASTPACSRAAPAVATTGPVEAGAASSDVFLAIARAEDTRRASDLPPEVQSSHDPLVRRAAARALARILDADDAPLLRALEDDDPQTSAWAAYGLGESCRGREAAHVSAIASRLASLPIGSTAKAAGDIDPPATMVRAVARCGGPQAEPTVRAWLRPGGPAAEAAALALGDLASRAPLSLESASALLEASRATPPIDAALYAFGRGDDAAPDAVAPRLADASRAALARPGPERVFAVRALGRTGDPQAADDLGRVAASADFTAAERVEALHALARTRKPADAIAAAITALAPSPLAGALAGDRFSLLLVALTAAGDDAAGKIEPLLWNLARLAPDGGASPALVRRASAIRCLAAERLARGAWDSDVLRTCDLGDGESGERARLAALDRAPIVHARRPAWVDLARSPHLRVREAALGLLARHAELEDAARAAVAEALASDAPGLVATAATFVQAHPERVFVLAASARRAALDPASPPPTGAPPKEIDPAVAAGLRAAMARGWSPDRVETRVAVLDAAVATGLDGALPFAKAACADPNTTVRIRATKALAALGAKDACPAPAGAEPAPEVGHAAQRPTRVVFETDAGHLAVRFDPTFAPVAVTRFLALARSGFYTGVTIHRVVPGFVVQFGDKGGDGYGGSGGLLRCETAPVPFGPLDVGVALAGRDTGSSQLFVAVSRVPHLDGQYARVGHAEGDWSAAAEGDVVTAVTVEE
jgi:cyclophilin family peptidyl-prolyl cis-trans isomerase